MSKSPLQISIANFVEHCQAIPTSLGSPGNQSETFSSNHHTFNIPYPNGITTGTASQTESQLVQIQQMLATSPPNSRPFVVDSFSTLDLSPFGFEAMFKTPWFYREPVSVEIEHDPESRIETINSPAQLQEFDRAAAVGFSQSNTDTVYSRPLLSDPRYDFYSIRGSSKIVAGVQTFTNDDSVGIYTLFTHREHQRKGYAAALVNHVLAKHPDRPAITNPSDESDHLFRNASFRHIGTRTIWRYSNT